MGTSLGRSCISNSRSPWLDPGAPFSSHPRASMYCRSDMALARLSGQVMFWAQGGSAIGSLLRDRELPVGGKARHLGPCTFPRTKLCPLTLPAKSDTHLPQSQDPRQPLGGQESSKHPRVRYGELRPSYQSFYLGWGSR